MSAPVSEDRPSTDADYTSNKYVGRPPSLPANIERELRDACEFILRDLKPSGHDIEDRRMKSDIFLETDQYKLDHKVKAVPGRTEDPKPKRQHSAAAWIMNDGSENDSLYSRSTVDKANDKATKPTIDIAKANKKTSSHKPTARESLTTLSPLSPNALPPAESPRAPMPTNVTGTRQPSMSASTKLVSSPRHAERANSGSTDASVPFTPFTPSTDRYQSTSTAATSNASSNRASDNIYTQQATVKDGQWMKQEVERHRQAQPALPSIATTAGGAALLADEPAVTSMRDLPTIQQPLDPVAGAKADANFKRPAMASRSSSRYSGSSWGSQLDAKSPANGAGAGRHSNSGSRRHSRPSSRLSIDGIHETKTSPQPTPRDEEVPPVPRLDAERLNSLTSASRNNSINQAALAELPQQQRRMEAEPADKFVAPKLASNARDRGLEHQAKNLDVSMTSRPNAAQTTSPSSDAQQHTPSGYQIPPVPQGPFPQKSVLQPVQNGPASNYRPQQVQQPQTSMASSSVIVRDFYRPKQPPAADFAATYRRNDPTPADFDALMSAMGGAVHGAPTQPSVSITDHSSSNPVPTPIPNERLAAPNAIPARRSSLLSRQPPPNLQTQPPHPPPQPTADGTLTPRAANGPAPAPSAAMSAALATPANPGMVNDMSLRSSTPPKPISPTVLSHPSNANSNRSSYLSPTRLSEAHSSQTTGSGASNKGKKRGMSRLFWRLGGGEMPPRARVYVPQYEARGSRDVHYWDDDEERACAAPVVGFGRGW